eukprot:10410979-Ditylum_brightwellii.AAC.1
MSISARIVFSQSSSIWRCNAKVDIWVWSGAVMSAKLLPQTQDKLLYNQDQIIDALSVDSSIARESILVQDDVMQCLHPARWFHATMLDIKHIL